MLPLPTLFSCPDPCSCPNLCPYLQSGPHSIHLPQCSLSLLSQICLNWSLPCLKLFHGSPLPSTLLSGSFSALCELVFSGALSPRLTHSSRPQPTTPPALSSFIQSPHTLLYSPASLHLSFPLPGMTFCTSSISRTSTQPSRPFQMASPL